MEYAVVNVPAAPVRRRPAHRKEMVNQLLFGETMQVLKEKGPLWLKIRTMHDGYEGWLTRTLVMEVSEVFAKTPSRFAATGLLSPLQLGSQLLQVPAGSLLPHFENGRGVLGKQTFEFAGHVTERLQVPSGAGLLEELTRPWLNAPYLWGGRTVLGTDCSGFTQVIFRMLGVELPRDAWQQAQAGSPVKKYKDARAGDLVFFNNKEDIVHTGILTGNDQIIHASGKVRVDTIDKKGIRDAATGELLLSLKAIRRFF